MEKNLKKLSRQQLLDGAKELASKEIEIGLQLVEYLREIESQLIFAELGYDSMWSFCVRYLKLSEGDTQRKLATMTLCKVVPEVKSDIIQGRITMTNAAKVQSFFDAEMRSGKDLPLEKKKEVLQSVHSLSKLACERKLMELSPASAIPSERLRPVTQEHTELKVVLDSETLQKLNQLKDLLAHTLGDANYQTLIQYMANETLKRVKKARGMDLENEPSKKKGADHLTKTPAQTPAVILPAQADRSVPRMPVEADPSVSPMPTQPDLSLQPDLLPPTAPPVAVEPEARGAQGQRQYLSAKTRRIVFRRANWSCERINPDGTRCGSQRRLEINHKLAVALGGSDDLFNLELTCRHHNVLHAQQTFGQEWMERFR